ncbi:MAG: DUF456 domain-containing protein [Mailhella sp.]|nr:DUF456 domain-containing protein [Mailhella sp.]
MSFFIAGFFLVVLAVCVLLNLVTLPGYWAMVALVIVWEMFYPGSSLGVAFFVLFIGLALVGEVVEFGAQIYGSKKYGSSKTSTAAGVIGAIAGALAGAPFMFGVGAIFGALFGAWAGCYLAERFIRRQPSELAFRAAQGAMVGKFFGMVIKFGIGMAMLWLTASHIWPELPTSNITTL